MISTILKLIVIKSHLKEQNKPKPKEGRKNRAEIKSNVVNVGPNISISTLNVNLPSTTNKRPTNIFRLDITKIKHNYMMLTNIP